MFLSELLVLLVSATPLSSDVAITPAVRAVAIKYGKSFGPEAEQELTALQAKGDETAAALLGELLIFGDRQGGQDFARACDYSEAAGRHASALHNLATCYFNGSGRPRDLAKARQLYRQSADMGFAKAACALGNMLIAGTGGPSNPAEGLDLCRGAADTGLADAQTDYGGYLLTGKNIAKNAVEARRYLSLAAAQGQRNAAFLLGQIYWNGDGIDKNVPEAAVWWIKAYDKGRTDAAFLIGNAAFSLVVEAAQTRQPIATPVIEQAKRWLDIAAEKDPDPKKREKATVMRALLDRLLAGR